jgi:hypothetical protein
MKHHYKEYEIDTSARKESNNYWTGKASIRPAVARVRGVQVFGNFLNQTHSEDAVFELAKLQIDMHTNKQK